MGSEDGDFSYLSLHVNKSEFPKSLEGFGCLFLKLHSVEAFGKVDGVVAGDWLELLVLYHFNLFLVS